MQLPEDMRHHPFTDWNYLVKGLMEAWNLSAQLGLQDHLEGHVAHDPDGAVTELLARIGNDCSTLASLLNARSASERPGETAPVIFAVNVRCDEGPECVCAGLSPLAAGELPPHTPRRFALPARVSEARARW